MEEVGDFKSFSSAFVPQARDPQGLTGHTKPHTMLFTRRGDGIPIMQYKEYMSDETWLPADGIILFKTDEDGQLLHMPSRDMAPPLVKVKEMNYKVTAKPCIFLYVS